MSDDKMPADWRLGLCTDEIERLRAERDALKVACRDAHTAEAEAMAVLLGCEEQVEQLRAALRGWDALIRFQYTGSQEAMEAMHRCAQRTNDVMKEQK